MLQSLRFALVWAILAAAAWPRTQLFGLADSSSATFKLFDSTPTPVGTLGGVVGARRIAGDGAGRFWVTSASQQRVLHVDTDIGSSVVHVIAGLPMGLAMTAAGSAYVAVRQLTSGAGQIITLSPSGTIAASFATLPYPDLVAIDRFGSIWVTHGVGANPASLGHYSPAGQLLGVHTLAVAPTALVTDRMDNVWVACATSGVLFRYTSGGDLVAAIALGQAVEDFAVNQHGLMYLAYTGGLYVEVRDADGANPYAFPVGFQPNSLAVDGARRLALLSGPAALLAVTTEIPGALSILPLASTAYAHGDLSGLQFAATAGAALDADGDGFANGEELDAGSNPFDPGDRPMTFAIQGQLAPGASAALEIESRGTPQAAVWLAASVGATPRGAGVFGFSLAGGQIFDLVQDPASTIFGALVSVLDATGRAQTTITVPNVPGLAGVVFYSAFRVYPDLPALTNAKASPAFACVIF
jgi:hypothetical protein